MLWAKRSIIILTMLCTFHCIAVASARTCVLPVPDGGEPHPSPPAMQGRIVQLIPGRIGVSWEDSRTKKPRRINVRIDDKTGMFTLYGGAVDPEQLVVGSMARIWLVGCGAVPSDAEPLASVVQVDIRRE